MALLSPVPPCLVTVGSSTGGIRAGGSRGRHAQGKVTLLGEASVLHVFPSPLDPDGDPARGPGSGLRKPRASREQVLVLGG